MHPEGEREGERERDGEGERGRREGEREREGGREEGEWGALRATAPAAEGPPERHGARRRARPRAASEPATRGRDDGMRAPGSSPHPSPGPTYTPPGPALRPPGRSPAATRDSDDSGSGLCRAPLARPSLTRTPGRRQSGPACTRTPSRSRSRRRKNRSFTPWSRRIV